WSLGGYGASSASRPGRRESELHPVVSPGRRNSPAEDLTWFHPTERLSRTVVQFTGDLLELSERDRGQVQGKEMAEHVKFTRHGRAPSTIMRMGVSGRRVRISARSARPSIPGVLMSLTTASYSSRAIWSSAAAADSAVST